MTEVTKKRIKSKIFVCLEFKVPIVCLHLHCKKPQVETLIISGHKKSNYMKIERRHSNF